MQTIILKMMPNTYLQPFHYSTCMHGMHVKRHVRIRPRSKISKQRHKGCITRWRSQQMVAPKRFGYRVLKAKLPVQKTWSPAVLSTEEHSNLPACASAKSYIKFHSCQSRHVLLRNASMAYSNIAIQGAAFFLVTHEAIQKLPAPKPYES